MYIHDTQIRVRYGETDQMGYLYHGHYALYYEVARVEWLRNIGVIYKDMEKDWQIMLPVVELSMRYLRPAFYDDLLTVRAILKELPDRFVTFYMEVYNEQEQLLNTGIVKLAFYDAVNKKVTPCPDQLMEKVKANFG